MLEVYIALSIFTLFFWEWAGGADSDESIWLNKKVRKEMIASPRLTKIGKIAVLITIFFWNFIVLPWMIVYYIAVGMKKLLIKDK